MRDTVHPTTGGPSKPPLRQSRFFSGPLRLTLMVSVPLCIAVIVGVSLLWNAIGGSPMTVHGWIALTLGGIGTAALTAVLMCLAFYSDRGGHDDQANRR